MPVPTSEFVAPTSPKPHLDDATATALAKVLGAVRASGRYPGLSAAIVFADGTVWDHVVVTGSDLKMAAVKTLPMLPTATISNGFKGNG